MIFFSDRCASTVLIIVIFSFALVDLDTVTNHLKCECIHMII